MILNEKRYLEGGGNCLSDLNLIWMDAANHNSELYAIISIPVCCMFIFSSVLCGLETTEWKTSIRMDSKRQNKLYDFFFFDQSLSKFSIQINFVVILAAQKGEFF